MIKQADGLVKGRKTQTAVLSDYELGWLVGIIEGEGTLCVTIGGTGGKSIRIGVAMTDRDVIETYACIVAKIIGKVPSIREYQPVDKKLDGYNRKMRYTVDIHGSHSRAVLRLIIPYLHYRRRARAWQCVNGYKEKFVKIDIMELLGLEKNDG